MGERSFTVPRNVHGLMELHQVVTDLADALAPADDQFCGLSSNLRDKLRAALTQPGISPGRADDLTGEMCGVLTEIGDLTAQVATACRKAGVMVDGIQSEVKKARDKKFRVDA